MLASQSVTFLGMEPQAALETAIVNLFRASVLSGGLGWSTLECGRRYDGRPPPVARGKTYAAVWSDGSIRVGANRAAATALDETFTVYVTVTVETVLPFDRWHTHRDELDERCNTIRALLHKDIYDNRIINAANTLAELRRGDLASGATDPVGFVRGLAYEGRDPVTEAGPDWLNAPPESGRSGLYQRLRFGGAVLLQDLANME